MRHDHKWLVRGPILNFAGMINLVTSHIGLDLADVTAVMGPRRTLNGSVHRGPGKSFVEVRRTSFKYELSDSECLDKRQHGLEECVAC